LKCLSWQIYVLKHQYDILCVFDFHIYRKNERIAHTITTSIYRFPVISIPDTSVFRLHRSRVVCIKPMIYVWYIVMPSYKIRPFLSDHWCFFLCWEGGILHQPFIRIFAPFHIVGIASLGNIPIRLTGFQMGIHHLWSSIVGYWEIITFFCFTCAYRKLTCWTFFSNHVTPV
jgi:hypothetical protein